MIYYRYSEQFIGVIFKLPTSQVLNSVAVGHLSSIAHEFEGAGSLSTAMVSPLMHSYLRQLIELLTSTDFQGVAAKLISVLLHFNEEEHSLFMDQYVREDKRSRKTTVFNHQDTESFFTALQVKSMGMLSTATQASHFRGANLLLNK